MIDLAIIGAGPAGLSAAIEARRLGLSVALFDEQPTPGGQIYRNVTAARSARMGAVLGGDYAAGRPLVQTFLSCGADYLSQAMVWRIGDDGLSYTTPTGGADQPAARVLVATGAIERPMALPGWTLPGVMTAGAAQILLKTTETVADGAVFIGSGPLLYLVACQYLEAGVKISAILDTSEPGATRAALPHLPRALLQPKLLWKGLALLTRLVRSGVPFHRHVSDLRLEGDTVLSGVSWRSGGQDHRIACQHAFLNHGVIPNPNITMAARANHRWDEAQVCWVVDRDGTGKTSLPWLWVAGDGGRIGGARAAALEGTIAAQAVARDLGRVAPDPSLMRPKLRRETSARPFLDRMYRPAQALLAPQADDTVICRCEEVTRGDIARAVFEGCPGPNQLKAFTRAGMGPCQGRMCGATVAAVFSEMTGQSPAETGYYRLRMPVKPVTVGQVAGLAPVSSETSKERN